MTNEEKLARIQELEARTDLNVEEQMELEALKKEAGEVTQTSSDEAPVDATPEGEAEAVKEEETAAV